MKKCPQNHNSHVIVILNIFLIEIKNISHWQDPHSHRHGGK